MTFLEIIRHPDTRFVDVRTVAEFNSGHLNGAVHIPLDQFQTRYAEIDRLGEVPVVFYCRSGNRSGQAVAYLQQKGVKNIYNGGGLDDLLYHLN
ncbi:MAG: rhodanese-like domain-containing protein [Chitinophagaceae bacterium]